MIKKKSFDFKNPLVWGSAIVSIGIVLTFLTKFADFIRIPDAVAAEGKRIDKLEESTQQIAQVLTKQEIINDYINKKERKSDEQKILSPDGKKYWEEETKSWRKL